MFISKIKFVVYFKMDGFIQIVRIKLQFCTNYMLQQLFFINFVFFLPHRAHRHQKPALTLIAIFSPTATAIFSPSSPRRSQVRDRRGSFCPEVRFSSSNLVKNHSSRTLFSLLCAFLGGIKVSCSFLVNISFP